MLTPTSKDLNLINQAETHAYLAEHKPDEVIIAAAKVGGVYANSTYPAEFIYKNLMIAANAIDLSSRCPSPSLSRKLVYLSPIGIPTHA